MEVLVEVKALEVPCSPLNSKRVVQLGVGGNPEINAVIPLPRASSSSSNDRIQPSDDLDEQNVDAVMREIQLRATQNFQTFYLLGEIWGESFPIVTVNSYVLTSIQAANLRPSLDVIVERFGAHSFSACNRPNQHPALLEDSKGCWIKVAPKKRTRLLPWVEVRQEVPLSENPRSVLSKSLKQLKQNAVTLQEKKEFCMRPMNLWSRHHPKRCHYITNGDVDVLSPILNDVIADLTDPVAEVVNAVLLDEGNKWLLSRSSVAVMQECRSLTSQGFYKRVFSYHYVNVTI
ncbi:hypothetical protein Cgig2_025029 [Carnegiea gigantea]|uniref:Uncharacterized protein n=1 Tax=Carnegiea gigantea TaxID=171969 RepID=A0A9Q1K0P7_9CARY|nr:hypothetical protein Cgig2_025029 [Carnegiea gigantea]